MGRMQVLHGNASITLGTLAALTGITTGLEIDGSREQGVRIRQLKAAISFSGKTTGEGGILVGFSTDLSATELTEALVADPQGISDIPATEQGNRKVFPVWLIGSSQVAGVLPLEQELREINYPWKQIDEGSGIQLFAFNLGSGALTTGGGMSVTYVAVQEWLDD